MPNLDSIELWKERIRWGLKYQHTCTKPQQWRQARRWYANRYGDGVVSVNLVFAIGRKMVIDLYFKNPTILVKATHPEAVTNAPVMESVDRDLVRVMNYKDELKHVILDTFLTNLGCMKFGFHSWSNLTPASSGSARTSGTGAMTALTDLLGELFGAPSTPAPSGTTLDDAKYHLYNYHTSIKPDAPWGIHWPTEDVIFPWGTKNLREMPWVAFRFKRPKFDMQHDPAYSNLARYKGHYTTSYEEEGLVTPKDKEDPRTWPEEMVYGFEVWDRQTNRVRVFALDYDEYFRNEDPELGVEQFIPARFLQFNPTAENVYGVSDVEVIHKQVLEYNETRTIEMIHKKLVLTRFGIDKNKIDKPTLEKFLRGEIMTGIEVNGDPNSALAFYTPPMSGDIFKIDDTIRRDIGELMNFSRNQGGMAESPRKSASEAMIIQQAIAQRADERRDQVGDFIESSYAECINPICWKNWTTERWTQVAGSAGFTSYIGADLKGYYGVEVAADSAAPASRAERKSDAQETYATLLNNPGVDQYELLENYVKTREGVDPSRLLPGGRTGWMQRMAQFMAAQQGMQPGSQPQQEGAPETGGGAP